MIKEKYYAVRIGNPRRHKPYLMVIQNGSSIVPELFNSRESAEAAALKRLSNRTDCKIVRVNVCETKSA